MNQKWFRRKTYGYGWTPATWQGWVLTGAYVLVILWLAHVVDKQQSGREVFTHFGVPLIIVTAIFLFIIYRTGEKPKWQWGRKSSGS